MDIRSGHCCEVSRLTPVRTKAYMSQLRGLNVHAVWLFKSEKNELFEWVAGGYVFMWIQMNSLQTIILSSYMRLLLNFLLLYLWESTDWEGQERRHQPLSLHCIHTWKWFYWIIWKAHKWFYVRCFGDQLNAKEELYFSRFMSLIFSAADKMSPSL